MNQAGIYHSNNFVQARDVAELLKKFKPKMKWDKKKIIDIGCGPGDVTFDYLFPLISKDAELLGIDISEPMIQFANSHYHQDSRLNFETLDILDAKVIEKYATTFDIAFSFYCFQWVQDQRLLKTLYSILKPGGETLFVQVVDAINYPLYEILAKSPKWAPYMKNYKNVLPPYRGRADPVSDIGNLLEDQGFDTKECNLASKSYTFSSKQAFYDWMEGVNPFSKSIPEHLAKEYEQEWKKIIFDENLYTYHEETDQVTITYLALLVFAQKPF